MHDNVPPTATKKTGLLTQLFTVDIKQEPIFSEAAEHALNRLNNIDTADVKGTAVSQIELLSRFYDLALSQAQRSFRWALAAGMTGLIFFLLAIAFMLATNKDVAITTLIGGTMIEFIAGINFYLYNKTLRQLTLFQGRLEITQRFLLANSLCESLGEEYRDKTRADLIRRLTTPHKQDRQATPLEPR